MSEREDIQNEIRETKALLGRLEERLAELNKPVSITLPYLTERIGDRDLEIHIPTGIGVPDSIEFRFPWGRSGKYTR